MNDPVAGFLVLGIVSHKKADHFLSHTTVVLYFHQHFLRTSWILLIKDLTCLHILNQTNPFSFCFGSLGDAGPHFTVLLMLCINNKKNSRHFLKPFISTS